MFNYKMIFLLMLINTCQVNAVVLTGDVTGVFSGDQTFIEWGTVKAFRGAKSSLTYNSIDDFSENDGAVFRIATLIYNNTEITESSSYALKVLDKSLDIGIEFTNPASTEIFVFNYDLMIVETDNAARDSADRVSLVPADNLSPNFVLDGQEFTFELIGFGNSLEGITKSFVQDENVSDSVELYAKITAVPVPSALWLFMTALSGFIMTSKRKSR